jgi:hypothetical protein
VQQTLKDIAPYVAIGSAAAAGVLAVLIIWLLVGVRRLRRAQQVVLGAYGERDLVAHAEGLDSQVRNLRDAVEAQERRIDGYKSELEGSFSYRAVLRYDAFRESSGEQSCSIALLDRNHSGIVISTITSRDEARVYVKELRRGVPDRALSPEEVAVVEKAVSGAAPPPGNPPPREQSSASIRTDD